MWGNLFAAVISVHVHMCMYIVCAHLCTCIHMHMCTCVYLVCTCTCTSSLVLLVLAKFSDFSDSYSIPTFIIRYSYNTTNTRLEVQCITYNVQYMISVCYALPFSPLL